MIASLVGEMNNGKTAVMSYFLFLEFMRGKKIISNYDLNFPHYKVNKDWLMNMGEKQDMILTNIVFGFDELWIWLDCRKSQENTVATYFFLQSSKDDTKIFLTAQDNGQNELRLKNNFHKIYECDRMLKINDVFYKLPSSDRFIKPEELWEYLYIDVKEHRKDKTGEFVLKDDFKLKAQPLFNLYDTRQKIRMKQTQKPISETKENQEVLQIAN